MKAFIKTVILAVIVGYVLNFGLHLYFGNNLAKLTPDIFKDNEIGTVKVDAEPSKDVIVLDTSYKERFYIDEGVQYGDVKILQDTTIKYLSRDGSPATKLSADMIITLPGKYYVTILDIDKTYVVGFEVLGVHKTEWEIKDLDDMEEVLKYAMTNLLDKVTMTIGNRYTDLDPINELIFEDVNYLLENYPMLALYNYQISINSAFDTKIEVSFVYSDITEKHQDAWYAIHRQLLNTLFDETMVDYERQYATVDHIIETVSYDPAGRLGIDFVDPISHTLYAAAIENLAVCDGYSKMVMYVLNSVGVPTYFVQGDADGVAHAWNMVEIDGRMYHMDITWSDRDEYHIGGFLDYFNETDSYMSETHVWDKMKYPVAGSTKHNFLALDLGIEDLYFANTLDEVFSALNFVSERAQTEFSIVLEISLNQTATLEQISATLNAGLNYTDIKKGAYTILNISLM
ncbi:MAG: hypothetical protein ATN35_10110 [Epulopiscium sp. Nele67-Bin004]|nr:MAG: hypothetical protein ATN35_10110 [Epulopiscium sp. Nele67-Bin004]